MPTNKPVHLPSDSNMAVGATVNLRRFEGQFQLRIWLKGKNFESSNHDNPAEAVSRLEEILIDSLTNETAHDAITGAFGGWSE